MKKQYRPWSPKQAFLLPPSLLDWLPEDHLALFVLDVVGALDLSAIESEIHGKDPRGTRPFDPAMMVALMVYAYCVGVYSSRRIARACVEDIAFRVLSGNTQPHFTTINTFRRRHGEALSGLFIQVLQMCQKAGLVKLGHVALDGSKVKANASKHKAMSYERMQAELVRLQQEVDGLLARAEAVDAEEDRKLGEGVDATAIPAELKRREGRMAKLRAARDALEEEARQARANTLRERAATLRDKAEAYDNPTEVKRARSCAARNERAAAELAPSDRDDGDDDDDGSSDAALPRHRVRTDRSGKPKPKAQRNFTDPESRIMKRGSDYLQAYNCQAAVDEQHQIIVAEAVTNQPPDCEHLKPMLARIEKNLGDSPTALTADSGYMTEANLAACDDKGIHLLAAIGRQQHGRHADEVQSTVPSATSCAIERMRRRLATPDNRRLYARRKWTVEPVFGQIKSGRRFDHFSRRGLSAARHEWSLVCACHNLLKLFRYGVQTAPTPA